MSGFQINPLQSAGKVASIVVAGDLCAGGRVRKLLSAGDKGGLWGEIRSDIRNADLSIANLECPLTDSKSPIAKSGPVLSGGAANAKFIADAGFDVLTLANNHIADMGDQGIIDTLIACDSAGLKTVGAGRNLEDACQPLFIDINSIRIAVLAFAEQEFNIASENTAGAWPLDTVDSYYQITTAKKECDFLLVIVHGGNEHYHLPRPGMVKTCRFFVDCGANAVVCHHSHVPSGLEIYKNAPIIYGTGNLLFDWLQKRQQEWHSGYLVKLGIQPNTVTDLGLIPYFQFWDTSGLRLMTEEEGFRFLQEIERRSKIISDLKNLEQEWQAFCQKNRNDYLLDLFSVRGMKRKLFKCIPLLFEKKLKASHISVVLNLIRCESHREVIIKILSRLHKKISNNSIR